MKITVTQNHIDRAQPELTSQCPIALAVNDTLQVKCSVQTWYKTGLCAIFNSVGYPLSRSAKKFVKDFDNGEKVKPFTFKLAI